MTHTHERKNKYLQNFYTCPWKLPNAHDDTIMRRTSMWTTWVYILGIISNQRVWFQMEKIKPPLNPRIQCNKMFLHMAIKLSSFQKSSSTVEISSTKATSAHEVSCEVSCTATFVYLERYITMLMASHIFHIIYSQLRRINQISSRRAHSKHAQAGTCAHTHIHSTLKDPLPGGAPPIPRRYQREGGWLLLLSHKGLA